MNRKRYRNAAWILASLTYGVVAGQLYVHKAWPVLAGWLILAGVYQALCWMGEDEPS
jgi:hypothetical protein